MDEWMNVRMDEWTNVWCAKLNAGHRRISNFAITKIGKLEIKQLQPFEHYGQRGFRCRWLLRRCWEWWPVCWKVIWNFQLDVPEGDVAKALRICM
jgi:hypothetical protein